MMPAVFLSVAMLAAPQGVSVRVTALELTDGASKPDAELVATALGTELKQQGYQLLPADGAKPQALIAGSLARTEHGWRVHLTLVRTSSELELDDERLDVASRDELAKAGTELAKRLATAIRSHWGVRARIKF
jgi:hypothetical protein